MTAPTDPLEGIALPFAVPLIPVSGTGNFQIPLGFQNNAVSPDIRIQMVAGVHSIRMHWEGPESIRLQVGRRVNGSLQGWATLLTVPAGPAGTSRSVATDLSLTESTDLIVSGITSIASSTVSAGYRAGVQVFPTAGP